MCGRYAFIPQKDFYDRFQIKNRDFKVGVSYNIAPSAKVPVITANSPRTVQLMTWGFNNIYHTINARSEGIDTKPTFKLALKSHRCLIPASGFFEWHDKLPYWITLTSHSMFAMAGLYEDDRFTIITTSANSVMRPIHERMPVIVKPNEEDVWLDNSTYDLPLLKNIMHPYPDSEISTIRISPRVNNPAQNDPDLLKPLTD